MSFVEQYFAEAQQVIERLDSKTIALRAAGFL